MRYPRSTILGVALLGSGLSLLRTSGADGPATDSSPAYWKTKASAYRIELEARPPRPLTLREEPVLRWSNPVRKAQDGVVFVWTDRGRPEVVACFYQFGKVDDLKEDHEFMSISSSPLTAVRDGVTAWAPTTAGVTLKPIPDAPRPAATAAERLRQMRTLARDFKAHFNNPPDLSEIRLLTQPLYRYETEGKRADVLDGAVFAYVHTTDPEVLLTLEARPVNGEMRWHYALARMSMVNLRVFLKDREVWSADWDSDLTNPAKPYMARTQPGRPR